MKSLYLYTYFRSGFSSSDSFFMVLHNKTVIKSYYIALNSYHPLISSIFSSSLVNTSKNKNKQINKNAYFAFCIALRNCCSKFTFSSWSLLGSCGHATSSCAMFSSARRKLIVLDLYDLF